MALDRDVELKLERLCARYLEAQAQIEMAWPTNVPTGRQRRKMKSQVTHTIMDLQARRRGAAPSIIKLAYVRGMRSVQPEARLGEVEQREVSFLARRLSRDLATVESGAWENYRSCLRRMGLVKVMSGYNYPPESLQAVANGVANYPLEQYARASLRSIVGMAFEAGRSAASNASV